jgi:hypothetical protein
MAEDEGGRTPGEESLMASITFSIGGQEGPLLKKKIKEEALKRGLSVSEFCVEALAEYLRSHVA